MTRSIPPVLLLLATVTALGCSEAPSAPSATSAQPAVAASVASSGRVAFGFNGTVRGFPHGAVRLTGGGSYVLASASNVLDDTTTIVKSGGGFDCVESVTQGPLKNCETDEGVRWDTAQLLATATFKCTGAATEPLKLAATSANTAVLKADFYRAGDGIDESFTAQMIVSDTDIADDIDGVQTLWVQGVGCGTAQVNFN